MDVGRYLTINQTKQAIPTNSVDQTKGWARPTMKNSQKVPIFVEGKIVLDKGEQPRHSGEIEQQMNETS